MEAGEKEARLQHAEQEDQAQDGPGAGPAGAQKDIEHHARRQHGYRDHQPIDRRHALSAPEHGDGRTAQEPHQEVDGGNVFLPDGVGRIADLQRREQVEANCLGHQRKGAVHHGLGGRPRRRQGQQERRDPEGRGQHPEKRIRRGLRKPRGIPQLSEQPRSLPEIAQAQTEQHEGPGARDRFPPAEIQIGIKDLRARNGKEDQPQQRKAHRIPGAEQETDAHKRVQGAQHPAVAAEPDCPRRADEQEPGQHDRAEKASRPPAPEPLGKEEDGQQDQDQGHGPARAHPGKSAVSQAGAPLHRRGQRQRRRQDRVRHQRRAAERRREQEPPAALAHERVQGKMAALAPVVGTKQQQNALHGSQQQQRPEDQREGAEHQRLADCRRAAAFFHNVFHHVQRGASDVAVDHAERRQEEAGSKRFIRFHA